jgi:hypothetical protein
MEVFRALTTSDAKMSAGSSAMNERLCANFHEVCAGRHAPEAKSIENFVHDFESVNLR